MTARFFIDAAMGRAGDVMALAADERRHVRSRRLSDGERVIVLDGLGGRGEGTLVLSGTAVRVERVLRPRGEAVVAVTVLLGAAEPARVEWAIEKGTECGAAAFVLIEAARSQAAHVAALASRLDRLRRIAAEAVKQCDRTLVPTVTGPGPLKEALDFAPRPLVLTSPGGPATLSDVLVEEARRGGLLAIAIGPEGGFDPSEEAMIREAGAADLGLGPRMLRLETAVVAALSRLAAFG